MLVRDLRLLAPSPASPVSVRLRDGVIAEIGADLAPSPGEEVLDAGGALAIPGLWDHHVHVGQTAQGYARLDTAGLASVDEVLREVASAIAARPAGSAGAEALIGFGHRLVDMAGDPTVAGLDAVAGELPVVLIGGDAHHAWMSSAALRALGLPPRRGIVAEDEWFDAVAHLDDLPGVAAHLEAGVRRLQEDALARGVVGLTDMEWADNASLWARREARIRVRTATYASGLDGVPGSTGEPIGSSGLVTMGPLKVIADGSLGSRSAYCRHPYAFSGEAGAHPLGGGFGVLSHMADDLAALLARAEARGLAVAVHAIGDAAAGVVLDALAEAGAGRGLGGVGGRGDGPRIEHAQLLADEDVARMAALGVRASVQPAHLLDDRDPTEEVWPDDAQRSYRFRDLLDAGVDLLMGSDSPVAPVDPWLAMSAAVHRSADGREAWFPAQQLQPLEALAASTDGAGVRPAVGARADLVLLEDPADAAGAGLFADVPRGADGVFVESAAREAAARLREARPLATLVDGRLVFSR
ncbi:amidohydrolase family protein [Brachybacterium sp. MASK1Z-5]|uniref:Amidohydrolase family protein n=1 Tax=Brachybacterium halotolerans TaxID=2795215 RepID=A0ABS1BAX4_9MICO|nr:amidohydrolase family protein [Brachybacterium halotolerans]